MQMKEVIKLVKKHLVPVAKKIVRKGQQHAPIFFIGKSGVIVPISIPMKDDKEKDAVAYAMEEVCKKTDADFSIFINESWYVARPDGVKLEDVRPSKCNDKKEAVIFSINRRNGENACLVLPFKRVKGKVEFGKMETGLQGLAGRFVFTW